MPTAHVAYLNINQGLRKTPFWWPHSPSFKAIDELIDVLNEMPKPRIFGASEVPVREWNSRKNVFETIAKEANFAYAEYASSFKFPEIIKVHHTSFDSGNALFSDLPLEGKVVGALPSIVPLMGLWSSAWGQRTFMINKIKYENGSMYVIVAHFGLLLKSHRQAAAKILAKIGRRIEGPALLMLDANSPPVYVPDSRRYNYGSTLLKYLWLYMVDKNKLRDWIRDDHRRDRTLNVLEYGFPKDMCPVSCYKQRMFDNENEKYKTFEDRIIDYALGKEIPESKNYHVVSKGVSDHRMIAFELELPNMNATCGNIEDLIVPPEKTLPYTLVETAHGVNQFPEKLVAAVKSANVYARENLVPPLLKSIKRIASIL